MSKLIPLLFIAALSTMSCVNHDMPETLEGLVIKTGESCGWCAGSDSLTLTEATTYYEYHPACGGKAKYKRTNTDTQRWNELLATLDVEKFLAIDVNTCNVCADGCDVTIYLRKDNITHQIRFGLGQSPETVPIKPFVDKLNAWREEFKNN
jgi:hypothetical protein